jgi:hypothetical protein
MKLKDKEIVSSTVRWHECEVALCLPLPEIFFWKHLGG